MPEANLARLGSAVPMVVVSRDCAGAPGGGRRRRGGGALPMAMRLPHIVANSVPFPGHREWDAVFWQDVAQMYSQRGLGRQKGVSRARYSRDVFPGTVFHCFSRLKSYITSLSCQKQAVRACISAISCHEEVFLPSRAPLRMHDGHSLPLLDARPFHTGHPEGRLARDQRNISASKPFSITAPTSISSGTQSLRYTVACLPWRSTTALSTPGTASNAPRTRPAHL